MDIIAGALRVIWYTGIIVGILYSSYHGFGGGPVLLGVVIFGLALYWRSTLSQPSDDVTSRIIQQRLAKSSISAEELEQAYVKMRHPNDLDMIKGLKRTSAVLIVGGGLGYASYEYFLTI